MEITDAIPTMQTPDEYLSPGEYAASSRASAIISVERTEYLHLLDIATAVHGVVEEDKPFSILEAAWNRYDSFCERGGKRKASACSRDEKELGRAIIDILARIDEEIKKDSPAISVEKICNRLVRAYERLYVIRRGWPLSGAGK